MIVQPDDIGQGECFSASSCRAGGGMMQTSSSDHSETSKRREDGPMADDRSPSSKPSWRRNPPRPNGRRVGTRMEQSHAQAGRRDQAPPITEPQDLRGVLGLFTCLASIVLLIFLLQPPKPAAVVLVGRGLRRQPGGPPQRARLEGARREWRQSPGHHNRGPSSIRPRCN